MKKIPRILVVRDEGYGSLADSALSVLLSGGFVLGDHRYAVVTAQRFGLWTHVR